MISSPRVLGFLTVTRGVAVALASVIAVAGPAAAQHTGTLTGLVRDAQGGVLPGVTVTVTGAAVIGGSRTSATGDAGSYQFALPPGSYTVAFELSGFAPLRREGIIVQVARPVRVDVELGVGNLQETVTVSGASPLVDVSSTVSQTKLPYGILASGKYTARAGDPLNRTVTFTGLTASQASETVRLAPRGEDRTEDVTRFIDLRVARRFAIGAATIEPNLDLFNLLNANHVLLQNEQIGSTWGRPTRILTPRIIRFGVTARF